MIRLVKELAADGSTVAVTGRALEVAPSTYHEAISREPPASNLEDRDLLGLILEAHADSRGTYGAPRVYAELRMALGLTIGRKRLAQLMRCAGFHGVCNRRIACHRLNPDTHIDLKQRRFTADGPDRSGLATSPSIMRRTGGSTAAPSSMPGP